MPACASEGYTSGIRFRSSSPPNSRSNSASPPLMTWPVTSVPSGSPGQVSPIETLSKRSNSSLFNVMSTFSEPSRVTFVTATDRGGSSSSSSSSSNASSFSSSASPKHFQHLSATDREQDDQSLNSRRLTTTTTTTTTTSPLLTKRIFKERQEDGSCCSSNSSNRVRGEGEGGGGGGGRGVPENEITSNNTSSHRGSVLFPARLLAWYINLLLKTVRRVQETLSYLIWAPIIWISAWICVLWVLIQLPLKTIKWLLLALYTPADERMKRCVLINGGSTLQALHLTRNFYKAGARVVVCEVEGLFSLARYSTACARFYNIPRPGARRSAAEYVNALKKIVESENVVYYVPVSCTVNAYYDALAKPHLEIVGCECFVPGVAEVTALEDPLKLIQRCSSLGLSTPAHFVINSPDELVRLYEIGNFAGNERHVMISAGPAGMRERTKLLVPSSPPDIPPRSLYQKLDQYEISERRPWLVIRQPAKSQGYELVTCTTIKNSRVVANVTCKLDETRGLIPEDRTDVDQWLETFFARPFTNAAINGHVSFKLTFSGDDDGQGLLFPIECRVGVPLSYLCLTSVHPRLVWRPCRHFSRHNSTKLLTNERYKQTLGNIGSTTSPNCLRHTTIRTTNTLLGHASNALIISRTSVINKRNVLFVYWDPLPYCAYYHLQLPFRRLAGAIRERPAQHKPPLGVVQ